MIPRLSPNYDWGDLLSSFLPSKKNAVTQFEIEFAKRAGHHAAVSLRYGRSGLYFLLKALGIEGKKVILPSYTCVVMAHAISLSGNKPVFVDNRPNWFQPAPSDYLHEIDAETAMVIPTNLFGITEETATLYSEIKARFPKVFVLQDCAHCFFARDQDGHPISQFGDGALFGLNIAKLVNSVKGGMLTLRDPKLAREVRRIREEEPKVERLWWASIKARAYVVAATIAFSTIGYKGVKWLSRHTTFLDSELKYFQPNRIELPDDYARKMSAFEATMGLRSLRKLELRVARRQKIVEMYGERLKLAIETGSIQLPCNKKGYSWSHLPVLVDPKIRSELIKQLERKHSIEIGVIVDYAVSELEAYRTSSQVECKNAQAGVRRILNLPLTFSEGLIPIRHWKKVVAQACDTILQGVLKERSA